MVMVKTDGIPLSYEENIAWNINLCVDIFSDRYEPFLYPIPFSLLFWTHPFTHSPGLRFSSKCIPSCLPFSCTEYTFGCVCHGVERGLMCPPKPHYWPIDRNLGAKWANILLTLVGFHCDLKYFSIFLCLCTLVKLLSLLSAEILKCNHSLWNAVKSYVHM